MVRSVFFFQAEDGIRDLVRSRGLGDVYKRQPEATVADTTTILGLHKPALEREYGITVNDKALGLSLIHI